MNVKTVVLAVAALATAGVTAFLIQGWLDRQRALMTVKAPEPQKPTEGPSILIAKRSLSAGTFVKPDDLAWQLWPKGSISESYVVKSKRKVSEFSGAVVRQRIVAGEPVTDEQVVKPGARGYLAAVLTPGSRAVAVPVNATSALSGLVFPGDRVDLVLTHRYQVPGTKGKEQMRHASETLLTNVRVLALDHSTDEKKGKLTVPKTATLEVTPKQAEILTVGVAIGKISLSLRSLVREEDLAPDIDFPAGRATRRARTITRDSEVSRVIGITGASTVVRVLHGDKAENAPISEGR